MRLAFALPVAALTALVAAIVVPTYSVTHRTTLGADGGWDYLSVDSAAHRLYISRGTHVQVVSTDTDSLVGDVPNTPGVHGIAINADAHRGYTSNGRDSTVTMFDTKTLMPLAAIKVPGRNPDAILYDAFSKRVFTFNGGSANATAIDLGKLAAVGSIALGGKPEFATTDGKGTIFVNVEDTHEIVAFDAKSLKELHRWNLTGCEEPTGQAIDRAHQRLFAVCGSKVMVTVDCTTGKQVATTPIGDGSDAVVFDIARQLVIVSNGDGSMTVIHEDSPDKYTVTQTLPTMNRARTMTIDPRTHKLYTVSAEFGATPAPTAATPRPRPAMVPGSFTLLTVSAP
jgi:DNA-binding beta-propeller fold protein YncE